MKEEVKKEDVKKEPVKGEAITGKVICVDPPPAYCITIANEDGSHHCRSVAVASPAVGTKPATKDATITIDGKEAKREDLKPGLLVTLVGDPVTAITTPKEEKKDDKSKETPKEVK